jgi:enoyl-[acyl-carrier-protein] reductase (NADH)
MDNNVWDSLERANNAINELVEMIRKFFGNLDKLIENIAEAISDQARVELSRQNVKRHPPLKLVRTYSFIPCAKKNLPYQRRNY